jgi:hypothetical protein
LCVNATDRVVAARWLGVTVVIKPVALFVADGVVVGAARPMSHGDSLDSGGVCGRRHRKGASERISSLLCKSNRGSQQLAQAA